MIIRVWETLGGLILYKYPFKGLPKLEREEEKNKVEIFMVFQELKNIVLFPSILKPQKEEGASTSILLCLPTDACRISRVRGRTLGRLGSANDSEI